MNAAPDTLSKLPQTICDEVSIRLPDLKACKPHAGKFSLEELKKSGLKSPAVLVSTLGAKQGEGYAGHSTEFLLSMAAYVVCKDALGLQRDLAAANICQVLLELVPGKNWDNPACGQAESVAMHTLISAKSKDSGVSLWAVTWNQPITFFQSNPAPPGAQIYVGGAPISGAS